MRDWSRSRTATGPNASRSAASGPDLYVCPADTVDAPVDVVWKLLTSPQTFDTWADARVERVDPPGPAHAGQVVDMSSGALGLRFKVRFAVERVDGAQHELEFRGRFPLGISMHERITVRPVDGRSRVQYG